MDRQERGRAAERLARELLVTHGLEPLDANWRRRVGEIDLIMREPSDATIVFVEVRYRSRGTGEAANAGAAASATASGAAAGDALEDALESVDRAKRARLRRAALAWLQHHADPDTPARIDVVAIAPERASSGRRGAVGPVSSAMNGRTPRGRASDTGRPERIVARRDGCRIVWIVGAVEDAD